jgi:hypothetical protein
MRQISPLCYFQKAQFLVESPNRAVTSFLKKAKTPPGESGAFKKAMWEHRNSATRRNMLVSRRWVDCWALQFPAFISRRISRSAEPLAATDF